ncbi:MAG: CYTH domain-containing protein [Nanoarchaeota archaeon]|nr:CYTH domain-containing protein [Nanoarchaeota archaeon]MCG2717458.1 CYTH domain-containing protein [Nanoarchaeota archaeon]
MEIEAKFMTKPHVFEDILDLTEIAGYKVEEVIDISEKDTYLDTKDMDFHKQGMSFRIRKEDERFLVTLKGKPKRDGAIYSRLEDEEIINESDIPKIYDMSLDIAPIIKAKKLAKNKPVSKIFIVDKQRKRMVIVNDNYSIRIDMDIIEYLIEDVVGHEYELEIEAKDAPIGEVKIVRDFLISKFGNYLYPSEKSKYERGLDLLKNLPE